jgi:hypothetical protein
VSVQTQQGGVCRRHGNHMPCDRCEQRSASLRRAWTTGRRLQFHRHHMAQRESSWQPDELAILHEHAGRESGTDILTRVNAWRAEYGLPPRSLYSVYSRAHEDELYLKPGDVTPASRFARLCGVHIKTVTLWRVEGYITGRPWGPNYVYTDGELESFVRNYPWLVDTDAMRPSPLRDLHAVLTRRDPWLSFQQAVTITGLKRCCVYQLVTSGAVEVRKRPGYPGAYRIRASSLPTEKSSAA